MLLLVFMFTAPVGMASLAVTAADDPDSQILMGMVITMSMFTVGSFTALWLIANELEDPFGPNPNDMPMLQFHQEFCDSLHYLTYYHYLTHTYYYIPTIGMGAGVLRFSSLSSAPQLDEIR